MGEREERSDEIKSTVEARREAKRTQKRVLLRSDELKVLALNRVMQYAAVLLSLSLSLSLIHPPRLAPSSRSNVHDIGVTWHYCDQKGCTYKSKVRDSLKRHKAAVHDIDVKWHPCPFANCTYRAKQGGSLKTHMSHVYAVTVQWHKCDVDGCFYMAKEKGSICLQKSTFTTSESNGTNPP